MTMIRKSNFDGSFKSTEIGRLNRKIEQSVSGVLKGTHGATGQAIGFAKQRENFLNSKPSLKPALKKETA